MPRCLSDLELRSARVMLRANLNVPLECGTAVDTQRLLAALPTMRLLIERRARVIIVASLGDITDPGRPRPKLEAIVGSLSHLLGINVKRSDECVGHHARLAVSELGPGEVLMLENTFLYPGELSNDDDFAGELASYADVFINDDFETAAWVLASTVGVAERLPSAMGLSLEREVSVLSELQRTPNHPYVAILGGRSVAEKLDYVEAELARADRVLLGGVIANTALKAQGLPIGASQCDDAALERVADLLTKWRQKIIEPVDFVADLGLDQPVIIDRADLVKLGAKARLVDVGPATCELFEQHMALAKTLVWNGPLGWVEHYPFYKGSFRVAKFMVSSGALTVVGGRNTTELIRRAEVGDDITHVSQGGTSFVRYLGGARLPALEALSSWGIGAESA